MRQAIEEAFILDVLKNYTTYKRFFGLIKQVEGDPEVPKRVLVPVSELRKYARSDHPERIVS